MKGTFGKNVDYQLWRFSDISWIISETCWNFLLKLAWWYIVVLLRDHRNGYFNKWKSSLLSKSHAFDSTSPTLSTVITLASEYSDFLLFGKRFWCLSLNRIFDF